MSVTVGENSYVSAAEANAYWGARDNDDWLNAEVSARDKAILEATQALDGMFDWIGEHSGNDTYLIGWPRLNAVIQSGNRKGVVLNGIPQAVKDATCELALVALAGRIIPADDRGGKVKKEVVGDIEVEYMDNAPSGKDFRFIKGLLKGLYTNAGNTVRIHRV